MNDESLAKQLKYSSSKWMYVVGWNNVLTQLFTPFRVAVLTGIGDLKKGEIVWVEAVKVTPKLTTVFIIKSKAYFYYHFDILLD